MPGFHPSYRRGARQPLSSLQRTLGGHVAGLMPHEYQSNVKGWQPAGSSAAAGKRGRAAAAARAVPDFDVAADSGDDHDETPDVVVLDPPRTGAGERTCERLAALRPDTIVYVACDPAALARDARTLTEHGYTLRRAVPLDLFPMTHHVEVVATFGR